MKNYFSLLLSLSLLLFAVLFLPLSLCTQTLPSEMPSGTIIFEGEVLHKEGVRSTQHIDIPSIYTINWFSLDAVYDGYIEESTEIPVITIGGEYDNQFVVAHHAPFFDGGYKYIASVRECSDCIEGLTVYVPTNYISELHEDFSAQRNLLVNRTRTVKEKECKEGEERPILYISFGNIHLDTDGANILGSVEVKTRTNEYGKQLINLSAKVDYDTDIFGLNAVSNQSIQPDFSNANLPLAVEQSYSFQSANLSSDLAEFSLNRNSLQNQQNFIIVNTILQPTMALNFTLPITALDNLPDAIEDMVSIIGAEASFFCDGVEVPFDEIVIEHYPIGVYFENGALGGNDETIQYQFGLPLYNPDNNTYSIGIYASSSSPTRIRSGVIKVNYNSDAFTPGQTPTLSGSAANIPLSPQVDDTGPSSFQIAFVDNGTFIEDFEEISDHTFLYEITLSVDDCNQSAGLSFDEAGMLGLSTYVVEDNINIPIVYQSVYASNTETLVICCDATPAIATLDPVNIIAGDAQILTITGIGFGTYSGGSSVLFHNGGFAPGSSRPEYIAAGEEDFTIDGILKWTDSEIQVRVASIDAGGNPNYSPGSGQIIVQNRCQTRDTSNQALKIPYALSNYRSPSGGKAYRMGLRNSSPGSGSVGYTFEFDPSVIPPFANDNDIVELFGEALDRWCEQTEIGFRKNATINENAIGAMIADEHNTVLVRDIPDFEGARTSFGLLTGQINCGLNTNSNNAGYIVTEIDIVLDDSNFDIQPYIVREALMHELGHAQMLSHAWCEGGDDCLMYPSQSTPFVTGITDNDATGANRVTTTSNVIINQSGPCFVGEQSISGVVPIMDGNCGDTNGTTEIDLSSLKLYPNPTKDIVNVDEVSEFTEYVLRDGQGRIAEKGVVNGNSLQLDLKQNPAGIYLLTLTNDSHFGYLKIIKI